MSVLRYIDAAGKERDIADIDHLYELIQAGQIGYDSLVRDDKAGRWVPARDHELFVRIRTIANQPPALSQPSGVGGKGNRGNLASAVSVRS
jgi:hypothetical protein